MYFVITYKEYCEAIGETYDGTTPSWFYRIQDIAINTIRSEIVDTKIFPKNSAMLHQLKPKWLPFVIEGIARQIYFTYNNEYFLLNGVFANRTYNQTQYGEGPVDKNAYDVAVSHACTPCSKAFYETGWFCKRMDVHFDKDKYYIKYDPSYKDINWGQVGGNIEDQVDLIRFLSENYTSFNEFLLFKTTTNQSLNLIDTNIEALTLALDSKQDGLKGLPTFGNNKTLVTNNSGEIVWGNSTGGSWGQITGTLSNQTDLQNELNKKQAKVIYSATEPTSPQDNDVWVSESMSPGTTQKQSDWNQTDNTQVDFIKNKPVIPATQVQSDWSQTDTTAVDYIKNKPTIFSGNYNDLTNKPDLTIYAKDADLKAVAKTGSYNDLTDKPVLQVLIPDYATRAGLSDVSEWTADEDCYVYVAWIVTKNSANCIVYINNATVCDLNSGNYKQGEYYIGPDSGMYFLKKNDTIRLGYVNDRSGLIFKFKTRVL